MCGGGGLRDAAAWPLIYNTHTTTLINIKSRLEHDVPVHTDDVERNFVNI